MMANQAQSYPCPPYTRSHAVETLLRPLLRGVDPPGEAPLLDLATAELSQPEAVLLSAALLGSCTKGPLQVALPAEQDRRQQMTHAGLLFALANRPGAIRFVDKNAPSLQGWRRSFSIGSRDYESLYQPTTAERTDEASLFGSSYACFVNPHLSVPRFTETHVTALLRPWIYRLLPDASEDAQSFVRDVGAIIDDLLANVDQHAAQQASGQPSQSLLTAQVQRGQEQDLLFLSVIDNGPGILRTARPKLPALQRLEDAQLLRDLFQGTHAGWGRQRGLGLPDVWKRVQRIPDATLLVATQEQCLEGRQRLLYSRGSAVKLAGTAITLCLPLRSSR